MSKTQSTIFGIDMDTKHRENFVVLVFHHSQFSCKQRMHLLNMLHAYKIHVMCYSP